MSSGINWFRTRQRALVKAALSLFAFAWLQAAIVPCTMLYAAEVSAPMVQQHAHTGEHAAHVGDVAPEQVHCQYCPPARDDDSSAGCDHESRCAFPHDPQIDARALSPLYVSLPCTFIVPAPALDTTSVLIAAGDVPRDVPRLPLAISYCRFIE
jgi:hypothetical protein